MPARPARAERRDRQRRGDRDQVRAGEVQEDRRDDEPADRAFDGLLRAQRAAPADGGRTAGPRSTARVSLIDDRRDQQQHRAAAAEDVHADQRAERKAEIHAARSAPAAAPSDGAREAPARVESVPTPALQPASHHRRHRDRPPRRRRPPPRQRDIRKRHDRERRQRRGQRRQPRDAAPSCAHQICAVFVQRQRRTTRQRDHDSSTVALPNQTRRRTPAARTNAAQDTTDHDCAVDYQPCTPTPAPRGADGDAAVAAIALLIREDGFEQVPAAEVGPEVSVTQISA